MRNFSLRFWIAACLFAGALIGIYIRREPWVRDPRELSAAEVKSLQPAEPSALPESPDGKRVASYEHHFGDTYIIDTTDDGSNLAPNAIAVIHFNKEKAVPVCFVNDDKLLFVDLDVTEQHYIWHRIYPEWWWGHFYRPEVWLAILSGIYLTISIARRFFRKG